LKKIIIAIDGYSSCGKSTLAKQLAKELGYSYVDSGSMYRAVTLFMLRENLTVDDLQKMDKKQMQDFLSHIHIEFKVNPTKGVSETFLNRENVENEIREMKISDLVSPVSAIAAIRNAMVKKQQSYGRHKGIVMDGRDIGTTVFPDAELKIFMTAREEVRAKRRFDELTAKGYAVSMNEVLKNIESRDDQDTHRSASPLRQATDAIVLDNSDLNEKEQLTVALEWVKKILTVDG
jgi:cytidylate kinase